MTWPRRSGSSTGRRPGGARGLRPRRWFSARGGSGLGIGRRSVRDRYHLPRHHKRSSARGRRFPSVRVPIRAEPSWARARRCPAFLRASVRVRESVAGWSAGWRVLREGSFALAAHGHDPDHIRSHRRSERIGAASVAQRWSADSPGYLHFSTRIAKDAAAGSGLRAEPCRLFEHKLESHRGVGQPATMLLSSSYSQMRAGSRSR